MQASEFKQIRLANGLTQLELALKIGLGLRSITYYESGQRDIPKPIAILVERLKCTPKTLKNSGKHTRAQKAVSKKLSNLTKKLERQ